MGDASCPRYPRVFSPSNLAGRAKLVDERSRLGAHISESSVRILHVLPSLGVYISATSPVFRPTGERSLLFQVPFSIHVLPFLLSQTSTLPVIRSIRLLVYAFPHFRVIELPLLSRQSRPLPPIRLTYTLGHFLYSGRLVT